jgi:hypothetical protein
MIKGRRREMGLGSLLDVPLSRARAEANEARVVFLAENDPIKERAAPAAPPPPPVTFGELAESLIDDIEGGFRNEKHRKQWRSTLRTHAATLTEKPVGEISTEDIVAALKPIWIELPETASRVRDRIERVLDAAKAKGHRTGENPARWRGHLDLPLPRRQTVAKGHCGRAFSSRKNAPISAPEAGKRHGTGVSREQRVCAFEYVDGDAPPPYGAHLDYRPRLQVDVPRLGRRDHLLRARIVEMALAHTVESKAERAYRRARAVKKRRPLMMTGRSSVLLGDKCADLLDPSGAERPDLAGRRALTPFRRRSCDLREIATFQSHVEDIGLTPAGEAAANLERLLSAA